MLVPTFVVMALLGAGIGTSDSLMIPEHAGMLACMLAAMLLRRDEYSCAAHSHAAAPDDLDLEAVSELEHGYSVAR
jgi:hypothetical protein